MGLFSFTQEIAMDLGTANTIITTNGKIVVDEPSVVALDRRTDKMIAVGDKAKMMHEKTHENIRTIRPLRDGVIADFYACEQMIRGLIKMVNNRNRLFSPSLRMVIGVPSGSTEVELRAVRDSAEHAGGRDVYLIFEPMAAAIGIGIDVEAPEGNMIVDIGGGSTEIAVISLGGIVANNSIRIAGDDFTADIQEYMSRQHNVKVSERMAERIKINAGAALTELGEDAPKLLRADGKIDWTRPAEEIGRMIRAYDPWPGTFTNYWNRKKRIRNMKIFPGFSILPEAEGKPGQVLSAGEQGLLIACGSGGLLVTDVQLEGSTRMNISQLIAGHPNLKDIHFDV